MTSKPLLGQKKQPGVNVNRAPSESEIQTAIKKASERYARLGVITEILKGQARERYDYFLGAGFPKWRGTGYYYARFRPGLGSVLMGLFIFGGGLVHYGALYLSWKRQKEFIERLIRDARKNAWGDDLGIRGISGVDSALGGISATAPATTTQENAAAMLNRRQKRMQERDSKKEDRKSKGARQTGSSTPLESEPTGPQGSKRKVQASNGKVMIVDSVGRVFLEQEDEEGEKQEYLLDPDDLPEPTLKETILFRLPMWMYQKIKSRVASKELKSKGANPQNSETSSSEIDKSPTKSGKSSMKRLTQKHEKQNGKM